EKLALNKIPCLRVYNKIDRVQDNLPARVKKGICICAHDPATLKELLGMLEQMLVNPGSGRTGQ
ncbi:MAG: hypothetical protein D3904_12920, partial [Candidatus Electrothrix sp. EH2]|nr:hypothetical protein [Candidatus Electrothrix sp. EH2]